MKGLQLCSFSQELYEVPSEHAEQPVNTVVLDNLDGKVTLIQTYIQDYYGKDCSFLDNYHNLPLDVLGGLSFDEVCKLYYSSPYIMDNSVDKLFQTDAQYEIVRKIKNSMWRWGVGKGTWNEVVTAYDSIRRFSFVDNSDFEIRLDHTTGCNPFGYTKYSRTFVDGVFAYLVYYKEKHVMTIGFSVMEKKKLLIQQVQSVQHKGNRYLYRLPANRLEFVIDLFRKNFSGYKLYVIDGDYLVRKILSNYGGALARAREHCIQYQSEIETATGDTRERRELWLRDCIEECEIYEAKVAHLREDRKRLVSFYGNTGRFVFRTPLTVNGIVHRQVVRPRVCVREKHTT